MNRCFSWFLRKKQAGIQLLARLFVCAVNLPVTAGRTVRLQEASGSDTALSSSGTGMYVFAVGSAGVISAFCEHRAQLLILA